MTLARASFTVATTVAMVASLAACGSATESDSPGTGGSAAIDMFPGSGGSAALGTGGVGSAGVGSAGISGGGSGGVGSGGVTGSDASIPPTFDTVKLVLQGGGPIMPCAAAPCHGVNGMAPPGDPLELPPNDDQQLYTNLTSYVSKACGNIKLVDPGNQDQSAILKILTAPCGMTPRMPYMCSDQDGNCIPAEYIAAVAQWIANGAPP